MNQYRDNGAVGALLDEYQKSIIELQQVIGNISQHQLITIADNETKDPDCKSIQTILTHVVSSGYGYAIMVRKSLGEEIKPYRRKTLDSIEAYQKALTDMFTYNEKLFDDYPKLKIDEHDEDKKILARWGQRFDVEQLFEHAIVHILRHRRQIERFLLKTQ